MMKVSKAVWAKLTQQERDLAIVLCQKVDWCHVKLFLTDLRKFGAEHIGKFNVRKDGVVYTWSGPDTRRWYQLGD